MVVLLCCVNTFRVFSYAVFVKANLAVPGNEGKIDLPITQKKPCIMIQLELFYGIPAFTTWGDYKNTLSDLTFQLAGW